MKNTIIDNDAGGGGRGGLGAGVFEPGRSPTRRRERRTTGTAADQRHPGQFDQRGDERSDWINHGTIRCAIQWEFNALTNAAPLGCTNYLTFGASSDGVVFTPTNTPFLS